MAIAELIGRTITSVGGCVKGSDKITFTCSDGTVWDMYHYQDCCENVEVEDVVGDAQDLVGLVVDAWEDCKDAVDVQCDSGTWTFYNIQTSRGCVTLRWLGTSNGYYSERVEFEQVEQ